MKPGTKNSYNSLTDISVGNKNYKYYTLKNAEANGLEGISKLPKSLKVLLENLLRYEDDLTVTKNQIDSIKNWLKEKKSKTEIKSAMEEIDEQKTKILKNGEKSNSGMKAKAEDRINDASQKFVDTFLESLS